MRNMALSAKAVDEVVTFFTSHFSDCTIQYKDLNKYGADEVWIMYPKMVQTRELSEIVACSNRIGNTVSVGAIKGHNETCICFW